MGTIATPEAPTHAQETWEELYWDKEQGDVLGVFRIHYFFLPEICLRDLQCNLMRLFQPTLK